MHLATFRVDASVPLGHSLCGGWIKPAVAITEPLYALGIVLLGDEAPVVLCAVDWTGICNEAHVRIRQALARAAHTTPERIAVHAVHQHNAPFADVVGQQLVAEHKDLSPIVDLDWFDGVAARTAEAVRASLARAEPVTHLGTGHAVVERVASNRRLLGPDGKIAGWRASACKDPKLREQPEGLIDPRLRSVSFWNGDRKLATLAYYATHPMSYYGDGLVTSDFVGLAREARSKEEGVPVVYFTGCAGNVAAGKYNDGDQANRFLLAQRIHAGLTAAGQAETRRPIAKWTWRWESIRLPTRSDQSEARLEAVLADATSGAANRGRAALKLAYLRRARAGIPIELTCLRLGDDVHLLHLPGECFVEYQLFAQERRKGDFVAVAAYGDGGPWYVPTARAFDEGGYEPSAAFVDPGAEKVLKEAIAPLLR